MSRDPMHAAATIAQRGIWELIALMPPGGPEAYAVNCIGVADHVTGVGLRATRANALEKIGLNCKSMCWFQS